MFFVCFILYNSRKTVNVLRSLTVFFGTNYRSFPCKLSVLCPLSVFLLGSSPICSILVVSLFEMYSEFEIHMIFMKDL
jgi:hypothetical protein